jgi:CRP-like cAMP-binding protein
MGPMEQRLHTLGKGPAPLPLPTGPGGGGPPQLIVMPPMGGPPGPIAPPAPPPTPPPAPSIGDGFGSAQADTLVTGRFAVPRLPTNLGPVCTNLERILFLHCVPLFVDFEPEDLLMLARASEERSYTEGTVLFNQGDHGDEVFVIIAGRVEVMVAAETTERAINTIGPGDCLGEMSVIDGSPRSATAVVVGVGTRVLAIRGETFRRFVEERSHVSGKIIGVLANRLRTYIERSAKPLLPKSNPVVAQAS